MPAGAATFEFWGSIASAKGTVASFERLAPLQTWSDRVVSRSGKSAYACTLGAEADYADGAILRNATRKLSCEYMTLGEQGAWMKTNAGVALDIACTIFKRQPKGKESRGDRTMTLLLEGDEFVVHLACSGKR